MGAYIYVSVDEVQEPKGGMMVIKDHWWLVENGNVLGYKLYGLNSKDRPTPQCNSDKRIIDISLKRKPEQEAVFLPIAYWWPNSCY